ncbi:hypothetical protein [Chlamydia sp. 17-3921]|uniref:hypothetical protein n=1 Tax=Chlamydia sp. 17-3921 TaxID=2675798 RepID=UPI001918CD03|nr:hypothetical protein [Chlamydia sp. 17-3921]
MFKLLKNLFFLGCCFVGYFWLRKESIVENWLSNQLHTQVSIGRISPKTSGFKIRHLCIYNALPSERFPYAAEIEYINIRFSLISMLLAKKIEISDLLVHGANFTIFPHDNHGTQTNWSLLWKNFLPIKNISYSEASSTSKLDKAPILVKRCIFVNTRVHGLRSHNKDFSPLAVPSLEFHGTKSSSVTLPTLSTALASLLYLAVEESLYHLNLPGDIVKPLSQQAREHFHSTYSELQDQFKESKITPRPTEEIMGFVRELLFH